MATSFSGILVSDKSSAPEKEKSACFIPAVLMPDPKIRLSETRYSRLGVRRFVFCFNYIQ